jgi:hypothetical protein
MLLFQSWFDLLNTMDPKQMRKVYGNISILEVLWRTLAMMNGSETELRVSNQMFYDYLLGWTLFQRADEDAELERTLSPGSLMSEHAKGPCWPSTTDVTQFGDWQSRQETPVPGFHYSPEDKTNANEDFSLRMNLVYANLTAFENVLSETTANRKLFATKQGYLGQGPKALQAGDQVWLLECGRVPFVLRPTAESSCFTLVGECYMHGVMRGERWGSRWRKPKTVEICLV